MNWAAASPNAKRSWSGPRREQIEGATSGLFAIADNDRATTARVEAGDGKTAAGKSFGCANRQPSRWHPIPHRCSCLAIRRHPSLEERAAARALSSERNREPRADGQGHDQRKTDTPAFRAGGVCCSWSLRAWECVWSFCRCFRTIAIAGSLTTTRKAFPCGNRAEATFSMPTATRSP